MTEATDRLVKLIRTSDRTPWGAENTDLLTEALALAEAAGEEQYAYAVRMRLVVNAHLLDDYELGLATFAICEQQHTADPVRFPANPADMGVAGRGYDYSDIYWMWKWIPSALMSSPDFPAEVIEESLRDLQAGFKRAGLPDKCVAQRWLGWALERGDQPAIGEWAQQVGVLGDDDHSDCAACSRSELIQAALAVGDQGTALRLLDEIEGGHFDCAEEPAVAYSHMLDVLARGGFAHRVNIAVERIVRSEGVLGENSNAMARLVVFLVRSGQAGRALAIARRSLHSIVAAPLDVESHELTLAATARAAGAVAARSELSGGPPADTAIPEADEPGLQSYLGRPVTGHTLASLTRAAAAAARTIAARFDARNGSTAHTDLIEDLLGDVQYPDLTLQLPADPDAAFTQEYAVDPGLFRLDDAVIPEPTDGVGAVAAVTNLALLGREAEAITMGRRWLERIDHPLDRAALLHRLAAASVAVDPTADAGALQEESVAALREAGWPELADAVASLRSWAYADVPQQDYPAARAAITALSDAGVDDGVVGLALSFVVEAYGTAEEAKTATPLLRAADALVARLGHPAWNGRAAGARLSLLQREDGDPRDILAAADDFPADQSDSVRAWVAHARGVALRQLDQPQDSLDALLASYVLTAAWGAGPHRAMSASSLALAAAAAGRASEVLAIALFLDRLAGSLPPAVAGRALYQAGLALAEVDHGADAAAAMERVVSLLELAGETHDTLLGLAYRHVGEAASAAADRREAVRLFTMSTQAFETAGDPEQAAHSALAAADEELHLGNAIHAGQIAEAILESAAQLADPWPVQFSAHYIVAEAAARLGSDQVADDEVDAAYHAALALADQAPDLHLAATTRRRVLVTYGRWLIRHQRDDRAVPVTREAWKLTQEQDQVPHHGEDALAFARLLRRQAGTEALAERRQVLSTLLTDPRTPEHIAEQARRLHEATDPSTTH